MRSAPVAVLLALAALPAAAQQAGQVHRSQHHAFTVATVATGLENPWAMQILPDGQILVTERPGRMRMISRDGRVGPALAGLPNLSASGQGGLLDVALHPDFPRNRLVYFSYSASGMDGVATRVSRAQLTPQGLTGVQVLLDALPRGRGGLHFGSRLAFGRDGKLYVTTGDRYDRDRAQKLDDLAGKVLRLNDDGTVPTDNPFVGRTGARPEIYSYGHRNPQGLTIHPRTGALWEAEHGARGGDEVNLIRAGLNYGWPIITWGVDYSGAKIGEGTEKAGLEQPAKYWTPSISPSGMAFYTGDAFPGWRNSLFVGGLSARLLSRLEMDGERVVAEERLLQGIGRVRDVRQGPEGKLYLLLDAADAPVLRLDPA